jgi:hypothetical protein
MKSKGMRWAGHVAIIEIRNECRASVGDPEERKPLGRPRHLWQDNIRMDIREIGLDIMD